LQSLVEKAFQVFDSNSHTVKIFKVVNQAALAIAVTSLKLSVTSKNSKLSPEKRMTKDVRSADGWRIEIKISDSEICVSQSCPKRANPWATILVRSLGCSMAFGYLFYPRYE
jgi:hypothetical protein